MMLQLRDYQQNAIDALREGIRAGHKRQIYSAPTGSGKTETACGIVRLAVEQGTRPWLIVDRIVLADQTKARFEKYGLRCGIMQGANTDRRPDDDVVIATAQTLEARMKYDPHILDGNLIIIDEAHALRQSMKKLIRRFDAVPFIGLTATPHNSDLGLYFSNLIRGPSTRELIDSGQLVPFRIYAPTDPDLSGVRFERGDFVEADLEKTMTAITGDVVSHWQRLGEDRPTIAFCVNVKHAKELADQFNDEGIPAGVVHGTTPMIERAELYRKLADGEIRVLTSVYVLGVGFDLPDVSCLIMARPTASEALFIQQAGRGARPARGKADCILLDHAGNTVRHGRPENYIAPDLGEVEKRTRKERKPQVRKACVCGSCGYVMEDFVEQCPKCLAQYKARGMVVVRDGRLAEIEQEPTPPEETHAYKRRFYKELLGYAAEKDYRQGWAVHQFQERYGCPPWEDGTIQRYNAIVPETPSQETRRWIQNRITYWRIRQAKSREARP